MWSEVVAWVAVGVAVGALWRARRDETRLERRLSEFENELKTAQALLAKRGLLAREIAHEIKNPLTAIVCSVDTLCHVLGGSSQPLHRAMLSGMKDFCENVLQVVNDFIDISRADAGVLVANPCAVVIEDIVDSVTGLLRGVAMRKGITFAVHISESQCGAYVDPKHLKQIVFNLIHNAIKFSSEFGTVEVVVDSISADGSDGGSEWACITVTDHGIGITETELAIIFDPYRQRTTLAEQGLGLGLPLTNTLVELAHGEIAISSVPGSGTVVSIRLPKALIAVAEEGRADANALEGHPPLVGRRVLLIDGDREMRTAVEGLVSAWGAMVCGVGDACAALELLRSDSFDCLVVDDRQLVNVEAREQLMHALQLSGTDMIVARRDKDFDSGVDQKDKQFLGFIEKPFSGITLLPLLIGRSSGEDTT